MSDTDAIRSETEAFCKEVDDLKAQGPETMSARRNAVECELYHMSQGKLPPENIPRVMRQHVIINLAQGDNEHIVAALEATTNGQPLRENFKLLYLAQKYLGNDKKATMLLDKI